MHKEISEKEHLKAETRKNEGQKLDNCSIYGGRWPKLVQEVLQNFL